MTRVIRIIDAKFYPDGFSATACSPLLSAPNDTIYHPIDRAVEDLPESAWGGSPESVILQLVKYLPTYSVR